MRRLRVIRGTRFVISSISAATIVAVALASKPEPSFRPGPASSYAHQKSDDVLVGARMLETPSQIEEVFGKKSPLPAHGITPVLVVIENNRKHTLDLRNLEVNIVGADGAHASATKPEDVLSASGSRKDPTKPSVSVGLPFPTKKKSSPEGEILQRAFAAQMIAPGDSASGFFYFYGKPEKGDRIYINGLQEIPSGKEITFFEFGVTEDDDTTAPQTGH